MYHFAKTIDSDQPVQTDLDRDFFLYWSFSTCQMTTVPRVSVDRYIKWIISLWIHNSSPHIFPTFNDLDKEIF